MIYDLIYGLGIGLIISAAIAHIVLTIKKNKF